METTETLALKIIERLKKEYPDAGCTLDFSIIRKTYQEN